MKQSRKARTQWLVGATFLVFGGVAFAFWVWPTEWVYRTEVISTKNNPRLPVLHRQSRFSGREETLVGGGWVEGQVIID